jgi:hypothetical protein
MLFSKIILCKLYENQLKHLQTIERKKKQCAKKIHDEIVQMKYNV